MTEWYVSWIYNYLSNCDLQSEHMPVLRKRAVLYMLDFLELFRQCGIFLFYHFIAGIRDIPITSTVNAMCIVFNKRDHCYLLIVLSLFSSSFWKLCTIRCFSPWKALCVLKMLYNKIKSFVIHYLVNNKNMNIYLFTLLGFPRVQLWAYLMKVIPDMRRGTKFDIYRFFIFEYMHLSYCYIKSWHLFNGLLVILILALIVTFAILFRPFGFHVPKYFKKYLANKTQKHHTTKKTKKIGNTDPTKNQRWVQVLDKGRQFPLLIRHPLYAFVTHIYSQVR